VRELGQRSGVWLLPGLAELAATSWQQMQAAPPAAVAVAAHLHCLYNETS